MDNNESQKVFDHERASVSDAIRMVGELEHIRAHALRSAVVAEDADEQIFYLTLASQAKGIRRDYMQAHFPNINSKLWCLCKATATLRQIAYEVWNGGAQPLKEIDNIVDEVWSKATGKDLSECESCRQDKGEE